jgi:hypothetical protein
MWWENGEKRGFDWSYSSHKKTDFNINRFILNMRVSLKWSCYLTINDLK